MDQPSTVELKSKVEKNESLIEYRKRLKLDNHLNKSNETQKSSLRAKSGSKRPLSTFSLNEADATEPDLNVDRCWDVGAKFGYTRLMQEEVTEMINAVQEFPEDMVTNEPLVIAKSGNFLITKNILHTLTDRSGWLDGEIMDFYIRHTLKQAKNEKLYAYPTESYSYYHGEMDRSTPAVQTINPYDYETLFLPVLKTNNNAFGTHWFLVVIRMEGKSVTVYDTFHDDYEDVAGNIRDYLVEEAQKKGYQEYSNRENWTIVHRKDIPRQEGPNCGIYVTQFIAFLANHVPINFKDRHMSYFRTIMQHEIFMHGKRNEPLNSKLSDALDEARSNANWGRVSNHRPKKTKYAKDCSAKGKSGSVSPRSNLELFDHAEHDSAYASSPSSSSTSAEIALDPTVSSNSCSSLASSCKEPFIQIHSSLSPMDTLFGASADHFSTPNTPMSMDLDIGLGSPTSLSSFSSVDNSQNESFVASSPREESPVPDNGYFSTGSQSPSVNDTKSSAKPSPTSSSSSASSYNGMSYGSYSHVKQWILAYKAEIDKAAPKSIDDYMAELPTCCLPADLPDVTIPRQMELEKTGLKHAVHDRAILLKGVDDVIGDYQTGDLVMAKHQDGGWATWPGLVVPYPYIRRSKIIKPHGYRRKAPYPVRYARLDKGTKTVTQYAIQFLGSEQLVDWVDVEMIDRYVPYEEYKENVLKARLANAENKARFVRDETPKTSDMEAWREANYEAEQLIGMSRKDRLGYTHEYVRELTVPTVANQVQSGQYISN